MTQKQKIENKSRNNFNNANKREKRSRLHVLFNKFLVASILLIGVYFIASINDLAIKGFVLRDLKNYNINLVEENKDIELKIMALESYENIDKRAQDLKMVKVDSVDYIETIDGVMAKK